MREDNLKELIQKISEKYKERESREYNDRVLIVDSLNTFIRSFTVNPKMNDNGDHIGGLSGFIKSLGYAVRLLDPTRVILVFDGVGGSDYRRSLYKDYKANRVNTSTINRFEGFLTREEEQESMKKQLLRVGEYIQHLPVTIISVDGIEADDAMSYIATEVCKKEVILYSSDKDFTQLVDDRISLYRPVKKKLYKVSEVIEEFKVHPINFHIYKSFMTDQSDNIKGVKGIGPKTLLKMYPELVENKRISLDLIKDRAKLNEDTTSFKKVVSSLDILELNYKLVTLMLHDFSSSKKREISELVHSKTPAKLNSIEIKKLYQEDGLWVDIPDLNHLILSSFKRLEGYSV